VRREAANDICSLYLQMRRERMIELIRIDRGRIEKDENWGKREGRNLRVLNEQTGGGDSIEIH